MKQLVYDGFIFFNELDLLEIRLNELKDVVDYHVIVESEETFSGNRKPLNFTKSGERFKEFWDKILYISINELRRNTCWEKEALQRDCIGAAFALSHPETICMVSDIDEIPSEDGLRRGIEELNKTCQNQILETDLYFYGLNYKCSNLPVWCAPHLCLFKNFTTAGDLRHNRNGHPNGIKNAGWHYSYCGGIESIKSKISSYSHLEMNRADINNNEYIKNCIDKGISLNPEDDRKFEKVEINYQNSPKYLVDNLDKYRHLLV